MIDSGTVLPFSAISGRSIEILPLSAVLPPVNFAISAAASAGVAAAGQGPPTAARTAPAPTSANISRRDLCLMTFLRPATARADPLAINVCDPHDNVGR